MRRVRYNDEKALNPASTTPASTAAAWRSLPALALPTWRSTPRLAPAIAAGAGLLLVGSTRLADTPPDDLAALNLLRITALMGALALAFLLDDRARNITETAPTPRPLRVALRLVPALLLAALWWTAAVLLVPAASRPSLLPLTLEAGAMATTALALATARVRFTDVAAPGGAAATGTLAVMAVAVVIPARWGLFALPDEPHWPGTHWRWALVLAVTALASAAWTPQPLERGVPHRLKSLSSRRGTSGPSHA
ncbi:ABC transporter [Streptomyces sp. 4F14]|uniref:ABC transporter n=1 Tax=Streptomyces sp. 4F14 TaxID=3394380 RepID=UPI003A8C12F0